jgi:hypothetical protein
MIEVDILSDVFTVLKEYIPSKDKQAAADHLFSVLTDLNITERDLKAFSQCDSHLQKACAEYFQDDDIDEEYDAYEDD